MISKYLISVCMIFFVTCGCISKSNQSQKEMAPQNHKKALTRVQKLQTQHNTQLTEISQMLDALGKPGSDNEEIIAKIDAFMDKDLETLSKFKREEATLNAAIKQLERTSEGKDKNSDNMQALIHEKKKSIAECQELQDLTAVQISKIQSLKRDKLHGLINGTKSLEEKEKRLNEETGRIEAKIQQMIDEANTEER